MIKNKKVTAVCMIMAMLLLGGCSAKQEEEIMLPKIEHYSKNIFETCESFLHYFQTGKYEGIPIIVYNISFLF